MIFSPSVLGRAPKFFCFFMLFFSFSVFGSVTPSPTNDANQVSVQLDEVQLSRLDAGVFIEIDGYDVSAFSQLEGSEIVVSLDVPLTSGSHVLNVLILLPDGNLENLLQQQLVVAKENEASEWRASGTLDTSYRLDEKEPDAFQGVKHLASNSDVSLRGRERRGKWELNTELDAIYDSISENNSDNNEWALPNYRVGLSHYGDSITSDVSLGEQSVAQDDLLFSSFQRRGAAVDVVSNTNTYRFNVFALQSETSNRYDGRLLPINEERNSSVGMTAGVAIAGEYLQLSSGFIHGETTIAGAGMVTAEQGVLYGGDSWNLALDSRALGRSLWVHFEYAKSQFDSDGIGLGEDEKKDSARQAIVQLSSDGQLGSGVFDYWSAQLQHQSIGGDFYTIGNLFLPGDRKLSRLVMRAGLVGFNVDIEWAKEESNVDDKLLLPTQTLERKGGTINYSPPNLNSSFWLWDSIGTPSISVTSFRTEHYQPRQDAFISGYDLNSQTDDSAFTLMFNRPFWNWSLQYQLVDQDDRSQEVVQNGYLLFVPNSDQKNRMVNLQLGWTPNQKVSINVFSQRSQLTEVDNGNEFYSRNYSLDSYFQLIPERLTLSTNYSYGHDYSELFAGDFAGNDNKNEIANLQLSWHALTPVRQDPGIDIYLKGSYGHFDDRIFGQAVEQWSVHFGVKLFWSVGEQQ